MDKKQTELQTIEDFEEVLEHIKITEKKLKEDLSNTKKRIQRKINKLKNDKY